jgi:hypothetical protein
MLILPYQNCSAFEKPVIMLYFRSLQLVAQMSFPPPKFAHPPYCDY